MAVTVPRPSQRFWYPRLPAANYHSAGSPRCRLLLRAVPRLSSQLRALPNLSDLSGFPEPTTCNSVSVLSIFIGRQCLHRRKLISLALLIAQSHQNGRSSGTSSSCGSNGGIGGSAEAAFALFVRLTASFAAVAAFATFWTVTGTGSSNSYSG